MTKENAIDIIKSECYVFNPLNFDRSTMVNTALDMAVKALKQADMLDKARVEIAEYGSIWVQYTIKGRTDKDIDDIVENAIKQAKEQVLYIIDKYKESEERDEEI